MEIIENEKYIEFSNVFDLLKTPDQIDWQEYAEGTSIYSRYKSESRASAALFKSKEGIQLPRHLHTGDEHFLLLSGKIAKTWEPDNEISIADKGDFVIAKPETIHSVSIEENGIVLMIFDKLNKFDL